MDGIWMAEPARCSGFASSRCQLSNRLATPQLCRLCGCAPPATCLTRSTPSSTRQALCKTSVGYPALAVCPHACLHRRRGVLCPAAAQGASGHRTPTSQPAPCRVAAGRSSRAQCCRPPVWPARRRCPSATGRRRWPTPTSRPRATSSSRPSCLCRPQRRTVSVRRRPTPPTVGTLLHARLAETFPSPPHQP